MSLHKQLQSAILLQLKEAKLQTLQKKCGNIEDKLKEHRSTRRKLKARFLSEEKAIEAIQTAIGKQVRRKIQFLSKGMDTDSIFYQLSRMSPSTRWSITTPSTRT